MKIKFKLSIIVGAILIGALGLTAIFTINQSSKISKELSLRSIDFLASQQVEFWSARMDRYMQILRTLANVMSNYEQIEPEIRRDEFDSILLGTFISEPNLLMLYTIWKPNAVDGMDALNIDRVGSTVTGQYATNFNRETGVITKRLSADVDGAMEYLTGPNPRIDRVLAPAPRNVLGKDTHLVRMMVPIINPRTNEVVGGVGILYDIAAIQPVLQGIINSYDGISAMAIYGDNGIIIGHLVEERVNKPMEEMEGVLYRDELDNVIDAVHKGNDYNTEQYSTVLDINLYIVLRHFTIGNSNTSFTVMLATSESFIMDDIYRMTRILIMIISAVLVFALAIVFITIQKTTNPIVAVSNTLKDISEGEGDLTQAIIVRSKDEVGNLAHYFNQTIEKIKHLIINIRNQAEALHNIGNDLASNMTETAAAINEITANTQSIKGRVLNQSASVTETSATMEQLVLNINKLNDHVEKQGDNISQASSAIEEMVANINSVTGTLVNNADNVNTLKEAADVGRSGIQDVVSDIQEIARESEGLLEINSVMENIASQTNLLSMNAAIEAAHAGEAGKGFAVVADEIRKLAENSSEQSKTISDVLKKIKGSIDKITSSTENVLNKFEAIELGVKIVTEQEGNIRAAMEEQGAGSKQVLEGVSNVNEITRQVKSGSTEMHEGAKEVIKEGENLGKVTEEITAGMNEMAAGANQINSAINAINDLSNKNREYIAQLVKEVSKFKVE